MRNMQGLTPEQIDQVIMYWEYILQPSPVDKNTLSASILTDFSVELDVSEAHKSGSKTRFIENRNCVMLGADAFPNHFGLIRCANSTMSLLACLCHELAHAQRYYMGFRRPFKGHDVNLDEAETSIHASYMPVLSPTDRKQLIEDALQRLEIWKTGEIE
jgi:hypothetical protein